MDKDADNSKLQDRPRPLRKRHRRRLVLLRLNSEGHKNGPRRPRKNRPWSLIMRSEPAVRPLGTPPRSA